MSDNIITPDEDLTTRLGNFILSEKDAHSRVVVLFVATPATEYEVVTLVAVTVKWLLQYGVPINHKTNKQMEYHGTHILQ